MEGYAQQKVIFQMLDIEKIQLQKNIFNEQLYGVFLYNVKRKTKTQLNLS